MDIPIPKGKNWKEERNDGACANPKPSKAAPLHLKPWLKSSLVQCCAFQAHWVQSHPMARQSSSAPMVLGRLPSLRYRAGASWPARTREGALPFETEEELALLRPVVEMAALMISESPLVSIFLFLRNNAHSQPNSFMAPSYRIQEFQKPLFISSHFLFFL